MPPLLLPTWNHSEPAPISLCACKAPSARTRLRVFVLSSCPSPTQPAALSAEEPWQTQTGAGPRCSLPPNPTELGMGEGGESICFLTEPCSFSSPNPWENGGRGGQGEPFLAAGDAARCPLGCCEPGASQGDSNKGAQTSCSKAGRPEEHPEV